jgi:signal transduction histidine kinase
MIRILQRRSRTLAIGFLVWALLPVALCAAQSGSDPSRQKRVLVLYSTRRDAQIATLGERELPRLLNNGLAEGVDYYSEYIDRARFPDPAYKAAFREFLKRKYRDYRFDVIISLQNIALEFLGENRNELFPGTPVVYFSNPPVTPRFANSTGLVSDLNFAGTLALVEKLQPETRHVFVVAGAATADKDYEQLARAQFRAFESRFAIKYLSGLPTPALEARLAEVPPYSVVYYLLVSTDGAGENFHPLEYVDRVVAAANAPVYSWVDSVMNHGIIGGSLKSQQAQIDALARLAVRVLHGERADDIPTTSPDLNIDQVDWRVLRRWGLTEARVPAGTIVKFREPSIWDRYRAYILGAIALILAQMVLIAGLLVQRSRRQRAEEQVRSREAELHASYIRLRELGVRLLNAQDAERSRIARDLHDDISQQVALLSIDLDLLRGAVLGSANDLAEDVFNRVQQLAHSVHDLSHNLHPAKLRLIGLVAAISGFQHELALVGVGITFSHTNVPSELPTDLTPSLFRVVQEAVQNAIKHGRAHQISVELVGIPRGLSLSVSDDGVGFDVASAWGKGLGLISMGERLEAVGGSMEIRSMPESGTRVEVTVPLSAAVEQNPAPSESPAETLAS